jgi:predicted NBD/HSP70 family sugar kinase
MTMFTKGGVIMGKYVVIDVGGSSIKYALMDGEGKFYEKGSVKTPDTGIDDFIDTVGSIVDNFKENHEIVGLACSLPGAVEPKSGIIYGASAIPYIHGPNIKELLSNRTQVRVSIENDANCAGLAEGWLGSAKDCENFICVVIGTGIGGCVVANKKILRGKNLHGGEFGYMLVDDSDGIDEHTWSNTGSTFALVKRVAKVKGIKVEELNGKKVFEMAEQGDEEVKQAIDKWYNYLVRGIFNLQYIIDPEKILIGGAISSRQDFYDIVNGRLNEMKSVYAKLDISVEKCAFENDANLIGALYNFLYC